jgi:hypothetical protein
MPEAEAPGGKYDWAYHGHKWLAEVDAHLTIKLNAKPILNRHVKREQSGCTSKT